MRIFLLILAALGVLLGVSFGGMGIWLIVASLLRSGDFWASLFALPVVCFGAIAVIIGIRYLIHQNTGNGKGIAGMVGFVVWSALNTAVLSRGIHRELNELSWLFFLGPIICGILAYRLLFWIARKSLDEEQNQSGEGTA